MKKLFLLITVFILFFVTAPASAQEKIDDFDVEIRINFDASIEVKEQINWDFDNLPGKHGIFRDIPIKYRARGGNFNLRISDISVSDDNGVPYPYSISYPGNNIELKIGDANKLVSGQKIYVINYRINRAINYFSDHDELYWNATGNEFQVPIEKSSAKIILPQKIKAGQIQKACFSGALGSTISCSSITSEDAPDIDSVSFEQIYELEPNHGLSIVVGWPKGIIEKPSAWQNIFYIVQDNWILVLPLIVFIIMTYLWWTRGRDPKGRGTIIAQYDTPDNLTPAQIGTLIDEKADTKDISSEIVYLATKGYLKITRTENKGIIFKHEDYLLEKLKESDGLAEHEKKLMEALFVLGAKTKKLSELKNKFYKDIPDIKDKIFASLVAGGYFPEKPSKIRGKYILLGGLILFAATLLAGLLGSAFGGLAIASLIASGIIVLIFGLVMPVKTKKGVDAKENILGLKLYMEVAEKDRIKFHNAPQKNPEHFEKLLPYAMVLGVEKEWAEKFKDIYNSSPNWYYDPTSRAFNSLVLIGALNNFNHSASAALVSAPGGAAGSHSGFGGGGFSGGGFGGGGGGSW
ncbi:MAG: hypothetical protein A2Y98_03460 [Candidatus Portnoybacteria bacterium RBG_19FT_COMBO_36_7]|uniref:DUF2207 domain-containing protein n=1 Tax=Candidatus Portnoybacteria bacterium RBG_19FT_COMBO_36_7 TaxID=1801992 RepID=A0A1G2F753_9BACT|nr:MAG: hypothetical protein A2Y98_03460 [Candidatus Portnoybacteria bacterium RBG_19FT_COMBO_36_7]